MKGHHQLQAAAVLVFGVCLFLSRCNGILVDNFIGFPFRSHNQMPPGDDQSLSVPITQPLLVNGNRHRNVHININGALTFTEPSTTYIPQPLPLASDSPEILAVFWTDLNSNVHHKCNKTLESKIFYKEYSDKDSAEKPLLIAKSSNSIYRQIDSTIGHVARCANISFETSWAFVVTWRQVAYYNTRDCDTYADFQVVLATDGKVTFALMNYANIDEKPQPALVGVNAGDGINFHLHPDSLTENIYSIDNKQGNTGTRGQWVFRIDHINKNTDYSLGSHSGTIHLSPSVGSYFGGTPVLVDGPCILELKNVTCTFGTQEVPGIRIKEAQYLCVTPDFDEHRAGPVPFSLTLTSHLSDTRIVSDSTFHRARQNPGPDKKVTIQSDTYPLIESPGTMTITWRPDFIPLPDPQSYTVDIAIYEVVISNATLRLLDTLARNVPNSGSAEITLGTYQIQTGLVNIRITMTTNWRGRRKRQGVRLDFPIPVFVEAWAIVASVTDDCSQWDGEEDGISGQVLLSQTVECPLTTALITSGPARVLFTASLPADGSPGTCFQEWKHEMVHPNASICFEQSARFATPTGPGNECCYDDDGNLCSEPNCAGTIDRFPPTIAAGGDHCLKHFQNDIFPALRETPTDPPRCPAFRQQRPSDGRPFIVRAPPPPPRGGNFGGDPHIITLDGLHYTFNGKGEFTLVETPDGRLTLQGRATEYRNDKIGQLSGTVFSAIAAKTNDSDTVQIEITPESKLITLVNGQIVNFNVVTRLPYNRVEVELLSETLIAITFAGGTYIEVREESGVISDLAVFPAEDFIGITRGLLGNFNNDTTDDLVPKGSDKPIPSSSSVEVIHKTVGITWIISNESESLFTYHDGESFKNYHCPHYEPVFKPTFSDPVLETRAKQLCRGDENCLFDVAATGSLTIGLAIKHANEFRNRNRPPPPTCNPPCANDGICIENNACICQLGWTGQGCSESDRSAPVVLHRCWFFGVLVWWSVPAYFDVSGYRLTVTEIIGGTKKVILHRELPSTSTLLRIKSGVQHIVRVEAKILGKYSPTGEETICCGCGNK